MTLQISYYMLIHTKWTWEEALVASPAGGSVCYLLKVRQGETTLVLKVTVCIAIVLHSPVSQSG